jgi:hypothetical protein
MKGVVFTEYIKMVEDNFGLDVSDKMIQSANLGHIGAYTSVGTYPHEEIVQLVVALSKLKNIEVPILLETFGKYMFNSFSNRYQNFFAGIENSLDFLEKVESYVHVEVVKLYPDAELPSFQMIRHDQNHLEMIYKSERSMGHFALGLIHGCGIYYKETLEVELEDKSGNGTQINFQIARK